MTRRLLPLLLAVAVTGACTADPGVTATPKVPDATEAPPATAGQREVRGLDGPPTVAAPGSATLPPPTTPRTPTPDAVTVRYARALAAHLRTTYEADERASDCAASRWLDTTGADRFLRAGLSPDTLETGTDPLFLALGLSRPAAERWYDIAIACRVPLRGAARAALVRGWSPTRTQGACIDEALTDGLVRSIFLATLHPPADQVDPAMAGLLSCASA